MLLSFTGGNVSWCMPFGKDVLFYHTHSFKSKVLRSCLIWGLTLLVMSVRPRKLEIPSWMVTELQPEPVWAPALVLGNYKSTPIHGWRSFGFWSPENDIMPTFFVFLPSLLVSLTKFQVERCSEMCKIKNIQKIIPAPFNSTYKNLNMSLNVSEFIAFICKNDATLFAECSWGINEIENLTLSGTVPGYIKCRWHSTYIKECFWKLNGNMLKELNIAFFVFFLLLQLFFPLIFLHPRFLLVCLHTSSL